MMTSRNYVRCPRSIYNWTVTKLLLPNPSVPASWPTTRQVHRIHGFGTLSTRTSKVIPHRDKFHVPALASLRSVLDPRHMIIISRIPHCYQSTTSSSSQADKDFDFEENQREEERSAAREKRIRYLKKVFSTVLFAGTLGLAFYGRSRKKQTLADNLKDCTRLPNSSNFSGGSNEFFRCLSPADGSAGGVGGGQPCIFPGQIVRDGTIRAVAKFAVRPDDVFVASFPKSGTTWVQEIVYLVQNDLDFKKASETVLETRFPFLEYPYPGINSIAKEKGPRLLKTHLPYHHLPKDISQAKLIYIVRNPKDVVVSFYHFNRMLTWANYDGRFEDFLRQFEHDELPYTPYFGHVQSYMVREDDPNILILSYEELTKDPGENIQKIASFLGKVLTSEEVQLLVEHTSFNKMKDNSSVNYEHWNQLGLRKTTEAKFMRKGKVGDWRNYFTDKSNAEFDEWMAKNNESKLKFVYDL